MLSLYHSYLHDELSVFSKLLLNYDFINYFPNDLELLNLWEKNLNIKNSVMLQSNGSTLDYQNYKFGPLASLVEIERILKYRYYKTFFLIGNNEGYNAISQSKNPMYDYYYHFDYQKPIHNLLWQHIHEKVVLSAQPHTWLTLTSDEEFLQGLNKEYILNTTDWEPFFRKKHLKDYVINDNMINCKTGINFYTCLSNKKHFLPIFILYKNYGINILNMANKRKYDNDDIFTYNNTPILCECGKTRLDFTVQTHCNNKFRPDLNIIEELQDHYLNLQFVKDTQIKVYYTTKNGIISAHDKDLIESRFVNVKFIPKVRLLTGLGKYYPFWERDTRTIEYAF
jgi:hypothetical protein